MLFRIERVLWSPPIPLAILVYFILRLSIAGTTPFRIVSTIWIVLWSIASLYNWRADGKLLRWLHDQPDPTDDVN